MKGKVETEENNVYSQPEHTSSGNEDNEVGGKDNTYNYYDDMRDSSSQLLDHSP